MLSGRSVVVGRLCRMDLRVGFSADMLILSTLWEKDAIYLLYFDDGAL